MGSEATRGWFRVTANAGRIRVTSSNTVISSCLLQLILSTTNKAGNSATLQGITYGGVYNSLGPCFSDNWHSLILINSWNAFYHCLLFEHCNLKQWPSMESCWQLLTLSSSTACYMSHQCTIFQWWLVQSCDHLVVQYSWMQFFQCSIQLIHGQSSSWEITVKETLN